jgi:hypothetical protein
MSQVLRRAPRRSPLATAVMGPRAILGRARHTSAAGGPGSGRGAVVRSQICRYESLMSRELLAWADELRPAWEFACPPGTTVLVNRKIWEWLLVAAALEERGMLQPGKRGLVFGVGHEPLVAAFAARGCTIVATDLDPERAAASGWVETEQHATGLDDLNAHGLCGPGAFAERVTFRVVDMTAIPDDLRGFDFAWSLCALEHLGSLEAGTRFVTGSLRCVRRGGLVVHTTEFNASSDDDTIEEGPTVLYRRRDIDALINDLRRAGHRTDDVDYEGELHPPDLHVDEPPYGVPHLRLRSGEFVATSMGLVIRRGSWPREVLVPRAVRARGVLRVLVAWLAPGSRRRRAAGLR